MSSELELVRIRPGAKVKVFHELDRDGASAEAIVTKVLKDGHIKATITEPNHELSTKDDGSERELTVSPDLYEVI